MHKYAYTHMCASMTPAHINQINPQMPARSHLIITKPSMAVPDMNSLERFHYENESI